MNTERTEARVTEAVEAVRPEFTPALRQRAMAAIAAEAPAPARPRRRWIAVAVGAAAVLIGLGFVPLPAGRTHGVLARAMATLDAGPSIHVVARGWSGDDEYRFEDWRTADGKTRSERWKNGSLASVSIDSPELQLDYSVREGTAEEREPLPMPDYPHLTLADQQTRKGLQERFAWLQEEGASVSERRERSLWGGTVDVIEATLEVEPGVVFSGVPFDGTGTAVVRAEVDPETNRVLSFRETLRTDAGEQVVYEIAAIEWDAEIADSTWSFRPPAGTKVVRDTWWQDRVEKQLAAGESGGGKVVLHAIDVARNGDVVLSLSRWRAEGDTTPGGGLGVPQVEATDSLGGAYSQHWGSGCILTPPGGYWIIVLHPRQPGLVPAAITLTVGSQKGAEQGYPPITFANLPLPPRQKVDDLFAAAKEVVQY